MSTAPPRPSGDLTYRDATDADVPALVVLVQSAYRGDGGERGWTTESHLIGGRRIDEAGIRAVMTADDSRMIAVTGDGGEVVACFQLERRGDRAYFGLFAVRPGLQGNGLGRRVITEAEQLAAEGWGTTVMEMTVISVREDLIAWYERRGYRRTGSLSPFPYGSERHGRPKRDDLVFEQLVKNLV
ncbi:GNAT family N-acetyltransferase [Streptomyces qinzhouensis]|uniref:GNAT family N-acetyltransferase n=1 Tax=Streptomyces qinzhouensis TaxID=2599401 RepID=A0A5B8J2X8_9ACTN|nr:GNAT family N-acetyltransferase [Streptomyces qinzhouensis]QDY75516.1 GNAT family N-acetyltransferase [Streptomyces qinzhouensis]